MDACVVYSRPDGGVSIIHPSPLARRVGESDDDFASRIASEELPSGTVFMVTQRASLPTRRWRQFWRFDGRALKIQPHDG